MAAETTSIEQATQNALASMNKEDKTEEKKEESVETTQSSDESKEQQKEEIQDDKSSGSTEATPEEITEALNFARAMKDPALAPAMIEYLATRSGFTKKEILSATPKEQKEIVAEVKALLPPGFEYLEEALLPAIKRLIKEGVDEGTKDIRMTAEQANIKHLEKVVLDTTTEFGKQYYEGKEVPTSVIAEVNRLSNIYLPQPGTDPKDHVMNLLIMAKGRVDPNSTSSTKTAPKQQVAKPSVKNVLSSQKTAVNADSGNERPKLSLEDSVNEALKSMQMES